MTVCGSMEPPVPRGSKLTSSSLNVLSIVVHSGLKVLLAVRFPSAHLYSQVPFGFFDAAFVAGCQSSGSEGRPNRTHRG